MCIRDSPRLVRALERAGRVARRQERISAAPAPGISAEDAARDVPALGGSEKGGLSPNQPEPDNDEEGHSGS